MTKKILAALLAASVLTMVLVAAGTSTLPGGGNLVSSVSAEDIQSENQVRWQETANGAWRTGTFEEAISKVYDGGQIVLLSDISLTQTVTISKSVTISSENQNKITYQVDQHGYLLNITSGTVTLTNIVIDGGAKTNITASRALIAVNNGTLILGQNVVLQNNNNTTKNGAGGGVCLIGGSIRMLSGSQISDNKAEQGGGVAIVQDANFYMEGGEILRNRGNNKRKLR